MHSAHTVIIGAVILGVANFAAAQATGSVSGRALMRSGGYLTGVAVTVTAEGVRRTVVTDIDGKFTVDGLAAGVYRVQGELAGFRAAVAENVAVVAGSAAHVDLIMRVGILEHVDYVTPAGGMRGALKAADVVVHLQIAGSLGAGLLGPEQTVLATQHAATVLAVVKSSPPGIVAGQRIQFWQHMAGEWQEGGRRMIGPETPYSVGQEFVAFLQDEPQGGRAELLGPHFMFAVKKGVVHGLRQPSQDLHDGMTVSAFLATLRQLLNQPSPPGCDRSFDRPSSETPHAEFERLYAAWHREAEAILLSSITYDYIRLPSYRQIVALGGAAVPALERKMREDKGLDFMLAFAVVQICGWDSREFRGGSEQEFRDRVLRKLRKK